MSTPLSIAVIGAGAMGRQHCQLIRQHPQARLCAVADPSPQAGEWARGEGIPCFADHQALLAQARPQAVIVANPNALHVATALDCIEAGVPVLLEKPLGVSAGEISRLVETVEASGVPVLAGHHRRHNPLIRQAHDWLQAGRLGRLTAVTALWQLQKPARYFEPAWRREPGAGMLLTNLIHDLDLLRHLCGEVTGVQAVAAHGVRQLPNPDTLAMTLQFACGALGSLTASDAVAAPWSWELTSGEHPSYPQQPDQPCYLLAGTAGALSLPGLQLWSYAEPGAGWQAPLQMSRTPLARVDVLAMQLTHFIEVARGRAAPQVPVRDAARSLALLAAVETALETGRCVTPVSF